MVYVAASLGLGEVFPFSRYSMYAGLSGRDQAAVPVFELEGVAVDPRTLSAFEGFSGPLVPEGVATGLEHELAPLQRHIEAHPGPGEGPGSELLLVWRVFRFEGGELREERVVAVEGRAW